MNFVKFLRTPFFNRTPLVDASPDGREVLKNKNYLLNVSACQFNFITIFHAFQEHHV